MSIMFHSNLLSQLFVSFHPHDITSNYTLLVLDLDASSFRYLILQYGWLCLFSQHAAGSWSGGLGVCNLVLDLALGVAAGRNILLSFLCFYAHLPEYPEYFITSLLSNLQRILNLMQYN